MTNPQDEQTSLRDLMAMEEVLLTGVKALDKTSQTLFVQHCLNPDHWAGTSKRKATLMTGETVSQDKGASKPAKKAATAKAKTSDPSSSKSAAAKTTAGSDTSAGSSTTIPSTSTSTTASPVVSTNAPSNSISTEASTDVSGTLYSSVTSTGSNITVSGNFRILVPGKNGAREENFLCGQTFIITGTFPEVGGGDVNDAGVANVNAMIQSFGGKVNTRFSKNTSEYT